MTHSKQVALVTGSTSGIGLAIARKLASENYLVAQNSRNHVDNSELILDQHYIADVTIEEDCKKLVERITNDYGRLDVLVCNVGSGRPLLIETNKKEYWDHYLNVNFYSATLIIESALNLLVENRGRVIAISSICADDSQISAPLGYSSAKAALQVFMKTMAVKHGASDVRFNVVSPGNVFFKGSVWEKKLQENEFTIQKYIKEEVPLRRFITDNDIAESVSFLVSEKAKNITGVNLKVDGGQSV